MAACHGSPVTKQRRFPTKFMFGAATSAYQIEGAWDVDGKGESIWDRMTHMSPGFIEDKSNGDIAADSYHNYKRDVQMLREMSLDTYRFSISWPRILPTGMPNDINPAGIAFYKNFINELLKYKITPMVTLYHWDLPQKLQELGGFANPLISDWFADYARIVFQNFGDRVKHFITFNEPRETCIVSNMFSSFNGSAGPEPFNKSTNIVNYLCAKHLAVANAKAYHIYDKEFRATQKGQCGITVSVDWYGAHTNSPEDKNAAELKRQGEWGIFANPIFSTDGGFPKELSDRIAKKSAQQGYTKSRLPEFTEEEKALVKGSADFLGVNHYTGFLVSATVNKLENHVPSLADDIDVGLIVPQEWPKSGADWLTLTPNSLYNILHQLKAKYNNPVFYITENGWPTTAEFNLNDDDRITYYRAALENVLDALDDGVNLKGYMAWSLMDNFEWLGGYTQRFGLYYIDFQDPARTRIPKKSAFVYKHIVNNRYLDHTYQPESMTMTIDPGH
ncbi:unnamed protein product [Chrysodeixis includens]|uniref:Cytosolic beta-glucosidase n=1 Tax=Chrysodeixis includens TaxID=689277 RepID=A0A9N8Q1M4_CHRIL|nr:unnamed protein product [Chrysodeixis includens]